MSGIDQVTGSSSASSNAPPPAVSAQASAGSSSAAPRANGRPTGPGDEGARTSAFAALLAGREGAKPLLLSASFPKAALGAPGAPPAGAPGASATSVTAKPTALGQSAEASAGSAGHGEGVGFDDESGFKRRRAHGPLDSLDPTERQLAQMAPPLGNVGAASASLSAAAQSPTEQAARGSLETLLPALVRRVAWSGDARKGAVRMELGDGELAGGTLLVQAEDGRIHVQLSTPAGADRDAWRGRIQERLGARGLDVGSVEVD